MSEKIVGSNKPDATYRKSNEIIPIIPGDINNLQEVGLFLSGLEGAFYAQNDGIEPLPSNDVLMLRHEILTVQQYGALAGIKDNGFAAEEFINWVRQDEGFLLDSQADYLQAVEQGKKAIELLVLYNQRLAYSIAQGYQGWGVPLPDLMQEASIALIKAAKTFDPTKGAFSSLATSAIQKDIKRFIYNNKELIRRPVSFYENVINPLNRYEQEEGEPPTLEAVMKICGVSEKKAREYLNTYNSYRGGIYSLDVPVGEDYESIPGDDGFSQEPGTPELSELIQKLLSESDLSPEQLEVITLILEGKGQSEIARIFGVSPQNVNYRYKTALEKLRKAFLRHFGEEEIKDLLRQLP